MTTKIWEWQQWYMKLNAYVSLYDINPLTQDTLYLSKLNFQRNNWVQNTNFTPGCRHLCLKPSYHSTKKIKIKELKKPVNGYYINP